MWHGVLGVWDSSPLGHNTGVQDLTSTNFSHMYMQGLSHVLEDLSRHILQTFISAIGEVGHGLEHTAPVQALSSALNFTLIL